MAFREIRKEGDPVLAKMCKPVKEITPRITELIEDMFDTMYDGDGCGLAACQVGVLRQIFVVDIGDENPLVFVNPVITSMEGEVTDDEGCLSIPGYVGLVTRAQKIKVKAFNENMEPFELEAEDFLARAIQHEYDHLSGHLYTEKVEGELRKAVPQDENAAPLSENAEEG